MTPVETVQPQYEVAKNALISLIVGIPNFIFAIFGIFLTSPLLIFSPVGIIAVAPIVTFFLLCSLSKANEKGLGTLIFAITPTYASFLIFLI